jgi:HEAT repeat protein
VTLSDLLSLDIAWSTNLKATITLLSTVLSALAIGWFGLWQLRRGQQLQQEWEPGRWRPARIRLDTRVPVRHRPRSGKAPTPTPPDQTTTAPLPQPQIEPPPAVAALEPAPAVAALDPAQPSESNPRDAQRRAVAYRRAVIGELRNLTTIDLTRSWDLEAHYVKVRVRETEPVPPWTDRTATCPEAGPPPTAPGSPRRGRFPSDEVCTTIAMDPDEALRRYRRIALLADPGAGKTTLLRHLSFQIARGGFAGPLILPVHVELRRFAETGTDDLVDHVATEWRDRYGFPDARPYLEHELESGRCALLLDGLDEVLDGVAGPADAPLHRVVAEIDRLATRYPIAPIAVTCRRAAWRGELSGFRTLDVQGFTWPQVRLFIDRWFERAPGRGEGLCRALATNPRMRTLAANPLLLSLITVVYDRTLELPERRAELFRRWVDVLLQEWDSLREIRCYRELTAGRTKDLLQEVAWHFHGRGLRCFPEAELLDVIGRHLSSINIEPRHAPGVLDEITTPYGLLTTQAPGRYGFSHRALQEYFTATAGHDTARVAELVRRRHDPWWEEVLSLFAGRTEDTSPLLLGILGRDVTGPEPDKPQPLAVDDDVLHGDLLLAATLLAHAWKVRTPWLRCRIVTATRGLLHSADHLTRRRAARALAEIRGHAITDGLFTLVEHGHEASPAVCGALATAGDAQTATRLQELLERRTIPCSTALAGALGDLRHGPAAPVLSRLLDSPGTAESDAAALVRALGCLGDRAAVETVLRRLRGSSGTAPLLYRTCAEALAALGTPRTAYDLMSELRAGELVPTEAVVRTVATLGGPDLAPSLLDLLLDPTTDRSSKPAIALTLAELPHPDVTRTAVDALRDGTRPWWLRYLLTEVLTGSRAEAEQTLADLVAASHHDQRVRLGAAVTLATWLRPDGVSLLRDSLRREWKVMSGCGRRAMLDGRHVSRRVATALHALGDESVVPSVVERFVSWLDRERHDDDGPALLAVLEVYRPPTVGHRLVEILRSTDDWAYPDKRSLWALRYLARVLTPALVPDALSVVEDVTKTGHLTGRGWSELLRAIGALADDRDSAGRLLRLVANPDPHRDLVAALDTTCRRGGLRAFPDGRVASVRTA